MKDNWFGTAVRQGGVTTTDQLEKAGVGRYRRDQLLRDGVLQRMGHGMFAIAGIEGDPALEWSRRLWVAVLGAGTGAVIFRRSARACWGLDGVPAGFVEIAVPEHRGTRRPGVYRLRSLTPDVMAVAGPEAAIPVVADIPVTTVARTIIDLGRVLADTVVERALECALRRQLVTLPHLVSALEGTRASGRAALTRVLNHRPEGAPPTESDAETLFLQIARSARLPDPERQRWLILGGDRYRVDFAWLDLRIAVEIDGVETHGSPTALQRDLRRQNRIVTDGWLILRFTWWDVAYHQTRVVPDLMAAWSLRGGVAPGMVGR